MPSEPQTSYESVGPSRVRGYSPKLVRSSKQHQSPQIAQGKIVSLPSHTNLQPKFLDRTDTEIPFGRPFPHSKSNQNIEDEILVQTKHPGDLRRHPGKIKESKDAELIKHMSNVPGYLQHIGSTREMPHENALNFGVLEWERLEKWRHMQKVMLLRNSINISSTNNDSSMSANVGSSLCPGTVSGNAPAISKDHFSVSSPLDPSQEEGSPLKMHIADTINSSDSTPVQQSRAAMMVENEIIENLYQRFTSENDTSSTNSRNSDVAPSSGKNVNFWDGLTNKRTEKLEDLDLDFSSPYTPAKHQNIVLLLPKDLHRNSCSDLLLSEPRILFDEKGMDLARKSFSDAFYPAMVDTTEHQSEYSYSCPLPCRTEINALGDSLPTDKANVEHEGANVCRSKTKLLSPTVMEAAKKLDPEFSHPAVAEGRSPSQKPLSDIVLGRRSQSFSLKESSVVPQLISYTPVRSGPVPSKGSASFDDSKGEKEHAHSRGKSSPLRRLLDPIRKHVASSIHSSDIKPLEGNLNSASSDMFESKEKSMKSNVQAFLQFTVRNGLPLFKFVVDGNNSNILVTTVKKSTESGEDDFGWIYTFYTLHEVKKKKGGGWTTQGNKGKGSEYTYNVVGHMKISNPVEQAIKSEAVLFGVELGHANHETSAACMPQRELAAIVSKIKIANCKRDEGDKQRELTENQNFTECHSDDSRSYSTSYTTVLLPDGNHGLPNEGAPSPLIDRWKSGGICDCGGWDIGCKLRVLTSQCPCYDESKACPVSNGLDLFVQGSSQDKRPVFSLVPLKSGIYLVKFNTSLSSLQAFSICVAVMNSERSSELLGTSYQFEVPNSGGHCRSGNGSTSVQSEVPLRFVPYPPYSPVGRI